MSSDNGKPGEVDWYDVYAVANYIERKYQASVEINLSTTFEGSQPRMLLCASIVGNGAVYRNGAAASYVIPFSPRAMRRVSQVAHTLLLELQEEFDGLKEGLVIMPPKSL